MANPVDEAAHVLECKWAVRTIDRARVLADYAAQTP